MPMRALITGTGHKVPDRVLDNKYFERIVDTSDEWIVTRTGIRERHVVEPGTGLSALAIPAAREAMEKAGVGPLDLDLILIATVSGDMQFPATAIFVQAELGATNAVAFDFSATCAGYLYGLHLANTFIKSGIYETILVIGGEILSSMVNYEDRATCVLFGDGAGANVIQKRNGDRGILSTHVGSDGRLANLLYRWGSGSAHVLTHEVLDKRLHYLEMQGNEVFRHAVRIMEAATKTAMKKAGITRDDIDLFIPHQANIRIINSLAKRLKVPMDKVYINIDRYGNTSAASVPIALNEALTTGRLHEGDICVMVAFGGGFTWGSAVVKI
jgi:3-oxoacyl-[acyl-carrier-protein] synthase-3